ncbi:MAG: hypothetical protein JWM02_1123 [Frankiales bacterium]|nr:hypothetical protein [Frankiales bacterium]
MGGVIVPRVLAAAALLGALVGTGAGASPVPAAAGTRNASVTVSFGSPSPDPVHVVVGQAIVFVNGEQLAVSHRVRSSSPNWSYDSGSFGSHTSSRATSAFTAAGQYFYSDAQVGLSTRPAKTGTIVVTGSSPPPTSPPSTQPSATPRPTAAPRPTAVPTVSPAATGSLSPSSRPVGLPGLGTGQPAGPARSDASSPPRGGDPSQSPAASVSYAGRGLVQGSSHRYGLPAAVAAVAVMGVASLLVRLLLAEPAARRRRTRSGAPRQS